MDLRALQAVAPTVGAVLHVALLVALGAWLHARLRRGADRPHDIALPVLLGALWALVAPRLGADLPVEAFHPLREGWTLLHVATAAGEVGDESFLADQMWGSWLGLRQGLRATITLHLIFAGWTAVLLTTLGVRTLGLAPGLVLGAVSWTTPATLVAATTDVDAAVAQAYVALGALLVAGAPASRGRERVAASTAAVLVALLLTSHRVELAALGLAGLVVTACAGTGLDARADRWPLARLLGWGALALLPCWLLLAWWWPTPSGSSGAGALGHAGWLLDALHPLDVHGVLLPVFLLAVLPAVLVVLAFHGGSAALARPLRHGLVPVALLVTYGTARLAAHGKLSVHAPGQVAAWELYRYVLPLLPAVVGLAVLGVRQLVQGQVERAFLLVLAFVGPVPGLARVVGIDPVSGPPDPFGPPSSAAEEVRDLARWVDDHPDCALLTRGMRWGGPPGPDRLAWAALVPRRTGGHRYVEAPAHLDLGEAVALLGEAPCAVAYAGLDCADGGCAPLTDLPLLARVEGAGVAFVHPQHGGTTPAAVVRTWHLVPGRAPAP
ncbi:MAG: hypothetical protein H6732_19430 [Alphaproteobacteria bacterium]|nr:hypothetical protein [Alphaproteobacteria bacterium]